VKRVTKRVTKRAAKTAARGPAGFEPPVSDDAVRGRTGRSWTEWFRVLDRAGARTLKHAEIAKHLSAKERVSSWWSQMVAVGYERAIGRRVQNQRNDGYSVSVSRTLEAPAVTVFRAFHDAHQRARWLDAAPFTIRTARAPRTLRVTWEDGRSHLLVTCTAKSAKRSQVEIEHSRLESAAAAARMKARWSKNLEKLRGALER
jgi:hypothetical protein